MSGDEQAIWITTLSHLDRVKGLWKGTSFLNRLRGRYVIPDDCPRLCGTEFGDLPNPLPVMFLSSGILTLANGTVGYRHCPPPKSRYKALVDLSFSLPIENLRTVRLIHPDYALFKVYNLPFIQLEPVIPIIHEAPLICSRGRGPFVARIKRRTNRLFSELQSMVHTQAAA
jgi:hypothetical protein